MAQATATEYRLKQLELFEELEAKGCRRCLWIVHTNDV